MTWELDLDLVLRLTWFNLGKSEPGTWSLPISVATLTWDWMWDLPAWGLTWFYWCETWPLTVLGLVSRRRIYIEPGYLLRNLTLDLPRHWLGYQGLRLHMGLTCLIWYSNVSAKTSWPIWDSWGLLCWRGIDLKFRTGLSRPWTWGGTSEIGLGFVDLA